MTHFELYRVVGRGGFGKVQAVKHLETGTLLAMKRMSKAAILDKRHQDVVWKERRLMASFTSPFLVSLTYAFQTDDELFLVMPFLQGGDLSHYLDTHRPMSESMCKFYAAEIILGLEDLHRLGYVYRDLKPANVLLNSNGQLRVSDFGLAKKLLEEKSYLHKGFAGTRGYAAPEVVGHKQYSFEADLWSLGVVVYELMHGQLPYGSYAEVAAYVDGRIDQSVFSRKLSPECRDFITRLLRVNMEDRLGFTPDHRPGAAFDAIKSHPWLSNVNWDDFAAERIQPPFTPDEGANCNIRFEVEEQFFATAEKEKWRTLSPKEQSIFQGFDYRTDFASMANVAVEPDDLPELAEPAAASPKKSSGSRSRSKASPKAEAKPEAEPEAKPAAGNAQASEDEASDADVELLERSHSQSQVAAENET